MKLKYDYIPYKSEFVLWLDKQPADRVVGYCMDPNHCPLVEWIVAAHVFGAEAGDDVAVTFDYARVNGEYFGIDPWMRYIIRLSDDRDKYKGGVVTAGRLKERVIETSRAYGKQFNQRRGAAIHFAAVGDDPDWRRNHGLHP